MRASETALQGRMERLERFERLVTERQKPLGDALAADMAKPRTEIYTSEIAPVLAELRYARKHLSAWIKPEQVRTPLFNFPARSRHYPVPYGRALVIGPWNYPFGLLALPAVNALAAGNRVLLKPSEFAPATGDCLQSAVSHFFDPSEMAVARGGPEETAEMIRSGPDIVFFTGGAPAGRKVMQVCSERLIPVVLELGGCNPCIVDGRVDVEIAARRVAWGKFFNAGQTCLAPNACYLHESVASSFIGTLCEAIERFYGADPRTSPNFGRIVNDGHFLRLENLLESCGGRIRAGGERDIKRLFMAPTLIEMPGPEEIDAQEEIFGPVLPLFTYRDLGDLLERLRRLPAPLAVYCFTREEAVKERIRRETVSGSLVFNGTLHLAASTALPFGGVGRSGMGRYHGRAGFEAFSYRRAELDKPFRPELGFVYPPYRTPLRLIRKALNVLLR